MALTFDTGALIALEGRKPRMSKVFRLAVTREEIITVPTVVWAQWWRGQRGPLSAWLREAVSLEPVDAEIAERAGAALKVTGGQDVVDAIVMASAARRGDVVYTSDLPDLEILRSLVFPGVRVLGVG